MLCMARCSGQSTVLTSRVSHWPQTPPGRHINITNKACRTLGSGKNPKIGSSLVKGRAYKYKAVVTPVLEYASSIWHPNNIKLINRLKSVRQKAAWWTPQRRCRISNVNNMLTTLGWSYLQHRCRKTRLVNTRWLSQYHKSPSFPFPVIPSAHLSSVVLTTGSSPFSPTQSRIETTSLRMWLLHPPLRLFVHVFQNQYLWSRPCPPSK